ncbi:hypothetical protein Pcinc_044204, partial [Petrolisthes cinctipes]
MGRGKEEERVDWLWEVGGEGWVEGRRKRGWIGCERKEGER